MPTKDPNAEPDISAGDVSSAEPDISGGDVSTPGSLFAPGTFLGEVGRGFKRNFQGAADIVHDVETALSTPGGLKELQKKYPPLGSVGEVLKQSYGSLNPVIVQRDESGDINYPGSAGATIGNLAGMLAMGKATEAVAGKGMPGNQAKTLTEASGTSSTVDIPKSWRQALPKLEEAARQHGGPENIPELTKLVQHGLTDTQAEYGQRMIPIFNQQIVPQNIVDAIRAKKVPNPKTAIDIAWNQALESRAVEFEKPFTYGELDQQRMSARDRLNPFYGKKESAQGAVSGSHADITADRIIENEARDAVYDGMQRYWRGQVPDNYFRDLKKSQSALINLKDQLLRREIEVSNMENTPWRQRIKPHTYVSGTGHVGGAVGNVAELLFPEYKAAHAAAASPFTPKTNRLPQLLLSTAPNILGNSQNPPEE